MKISKGRTVSKQTKIAMYVGRVEWASNLIDEISPVGPVVGVEVGLWKADFALSMVKRNPRLKWFGVDPYFEYGRKKRKQAEWDGIFERVTRKMAPYSNQFTFVRKPSSEGVKFIPDNVDFVFIDGNHDYDVVLSDLFLYEKKVRSGGIMSGHDYYAGRSVKRAVDEHVERFNRDLIVDDSFDPYKVFWWRIP